MPSSKTISESTMNRVLFIFVSFYWDFPIILHILAQLRRWASFLIEYQICLKTQAYYAGDRLKVEHIRPKPTFSHCISRPPPLASIPSARFSAVSNIIPASLVQKTILDAGQRGYYIAHDAVLAKPIKHKYKIQRSSHEKRRNI
jgi:hypothetical protein